MLKTEKLQTRQIEKLTSTITENQLEIPPMHKKEKLQKRQKGEIDILIGMPRIANCELRQV